MSLRLLLPLPLAFCLPLAAEPSAPAPTPAPVAPAVAVDGHDLGQRDADPRPFVEALLSPTLPDSLQQALLKPACGLYSLAPWLDRESLLQSAERVAGTWQALGLDPDLRIADDARLEADHAVLLLESPSLGVVPLCLVRGERGWLLSPGLADFSGADLPLDSATQQRLGDSLAWGNEAMLAARRRLEAGSHDSRHQQREGELQEQLRTLTPEDLLQQAAAALFFGFGDAASLDRVRALFGPILRSSTPAQRGVPLALLENFPWMVLDGFAQENFSPGPHRLWLTGEVEASPDGDEWRLPLLIAPTQSTLGKARVVVLYARRQGEGHPALVQSPSSFSSLHGRNPNESSAARSNRMLVRLIQHAGAGDAAPASPQAAVEEMLAALRGDDLARALRLSALAAAEPAAELEVDDWSDEAEARRESDARFEALRLVQACDTLQRLLIAPSVQELGRSADGGAVAFGVRGIDRAYPTRLTCQPIGVSRHDGRWRIDMAVLDRPEFAEILRRAAAFNNSRAALQATFGDLFARQPLAEAAAPDPAAIAPDSAPFQVWDELGQAWESRDPERIAACFLTVPGQEEAALAHFGHLLECFGHPSYQVSVEAVHRSGDWAALSATYRLPEGSLVLSMLAKRQDGSWRLVLPSLTCVSASPLELLRGIAEAWNQPGPQPALWQEKPWQALRQPGLWQLAGE